MATELNNMYLASGGTLALAFGTSATKVYGSVDADKITIAAGVTVVLDGSFNRGNDTIQFTGNAASYSVVRVNASTVRITDAAGTSVTIPVGSAGTQIQFADATRTLSGSSAGIVLGDQAVSSTAAALAQGTSPAGEFILTSSAPTVAEGSNGTKTLTYLLQLNKAPTSELSLNYQTTDAGTAKAGDDFQVVAGLVTFAPGQTAATVSVTVYGDTVVEADETVVLRVSGSKLVASVDAAGTIVNDDAAPVDPANFTVSAGDIASANASNVPVTRNVGDTGNKTVTIQSDGASATAGIIINGDANAAITSGAAGDKITVSGNGNNTITSGAGNDTVNVFGTGTNTINVGTGNDTVQGGTGNDTIVFAAGALGQGDVVDGGAGIDTVRVSGDGNLVGAGDLNNDGDATDAGEAGAVLRNIENIVFDGTEVSISATALQALIEGGLKSISGSSATTELTITGLNALTNTTLDLSKVAIVGGLEKITTTGNGILVLNTTQVPQIAAIAPASGSTLTQQVIVSGDQTVASAAALIASGVTAKFTLVDTAANLALAPQSVFAKAITVEATTDFTAAQAAQVEAVITNSSNASLYTGSAFVDTAIKKFNVTDTASMLANNVSGLAIADKVTATTAATVAEANAISGANTGGTLFAASYAVQDSAANLAVGQVAVATTASSTTVTTLGSTAGFVVGERVQILGAGPAPSGVLDTVIVSVGVNSFTIANAATAGTGSGFITALVNGLVESANVVALNGATSVTVTGTPSVAQIAALNTALTDAAGGLTKVAAGYDLADTAATLRTSGNAAIVAAADEVLVATAAGRSTVASLSVADAVAIEALSNTGANTYKLVDTAALLRSAGADVTAVARASGGAVVAGSSSDAITVADLNALVTKFGSTAFSTSRKVVDTAAELVKLTTTSMNELGTRSEVLSSSTATVQELLALNSFKTSNDTSFGAILPTAVSVNIKDTVTNIADAVKVSTTLTALNASGTVEVDGAASVKQIADINTALTGTGNGTVVAGYALNDTAANLSKTTDANVTRDIVDKSAKVTIAGTATIAQLNTIAAAFTLNGDDAVLGTDLVYAVRDTASAVLGSSTLANAGTTISITDAVITPADAVTLRTLTKFDRVYAIEGTVSQLNAASLTSGAPNEAGRAALAGATKVTLVDSLSNLFNAGVAVAAQSLASPSSVIASGTLAALAEGNATDKGKVNGFRILDGGGNVAAFTLADTVTVNSTSVTAVSEINKLSAIASTQYKISGSTYAALMGNGTGIASFVANAAEIAAGTLKVSEYNLLDGRANGKLTYSLSDSASALAASSAATAVAGTSTISVAQDGVKANATVAEAKVLIERGITNFKLVDSAANITAAGDDLLLADNITSIRISDGGEVTLSVDAATRVFDLGLSGGAGDGSAAGKYNLSDTAAKLAAADPDLIGFAKNVTATTVADGTQGATLAGRTSMGTIVFDVSDVSYSAVNAAADKARNVTVTGAISVADAVLLKAEANTGTESYKISDTASALAVSLTDSARTAKVAAIEAATGNVVVSDGGSPASANVTAAQATLIAAYTKPVTYDISSSYADLTASTVSAGATSEARNIVVSDASVTAAQAAAVLALTNSGKVTFTDVTGTASAVLALGLNKTDAASTLTVTGTTSAADAASLYTASRSIGTSGATLSVASVKDTAAALAASLTSANVGSFTAVEATTAATVSQAAAIFALKTNAVFDVADSYANIMRNTDAVTSASDANADVNAVAALNQARVVSITDAVTVAQLLKIADENSSSDVSLFSIADVYQIVDSAANIVAAMGNNAALLAKATSVSVGNGVSVTFDDIGGTLHIVGNKAAIDALPASLATANKLVEVSVAELAANSAYIASLPTNVNYRVVDTFANLTSGNALINVADGITVTDSLTMAQAASARSLISAASEVNYSLSDTSARLTAGTTFTEATGVVTAGTLSAVLDGAINVTATTPVTVGEAAILRAAVAGSGKATYDITVADTATTIVSGNSAIFNGATNITVTATTGGFVTATEANALLNARNTGTTVISHISDATVANLTALVALKGANETVGKVTVGTATSVANIKTLEALSSTLDYSLTDTAANLAAAAGKTLDGATAISLSTGQATLAQLAIIDAAPATNANTVIAVKDTAANILAATPAQLARASGTITISDTSLTAALATQLAALDAANDTFALNVTSVRIADTAANLLLADNAAAVAASTKVTVSDTMSVEKAGEVIAAVNTGGGDTALGRADFVLNLSDVYGNLALNTATANLASKVTITNLISASQARTAVAWEGTVSFSVRDTAAQLANSLYASELALADSVTVSGAALVADAGKLSEMKNVTGYTITDSALNVYNALNTLNATGAADRATVLGAQSITLNTGATVAQAVGAAGSSGAGEKIGIGSVTGLAFRVSDGGTEIAAALRSPAQSSVLLNATSVALNGTAGVSIADLTLAKDVLGTAFQYFDHDTSATTAARYYIADTAANLSAADQSFVGAATTVEAIGTGNADTIDLSGMALGVAITGGAGIDTITVTGGADRVVLHSALTADRDVISGFSFGSDKIVLDDDVFAGLGTGTGDIFIGGLALAAYGEGADLATAKTNSTLTSGAAILAVTSGSDTLIYYDTDVTDVSNAVLIATLQGVAIADLGASNFVVIG